MAVAASGPLATKAFGKVNLGLLVTIAIGFLVLGVALALFLVKFVFGRPA